MGLKQLVKKILPKSVTDSIILKYRVNLLSTAQSGQDFWVYSEVFNEKRDGYFLDIGAYDGVGLSNTFLLEKRYGWKGICIEGNPLTFEILRKTRSCICLNECIDQEEGTVEFALDGVLGGIVSKDTDNSGAITAKTVTLKTKPLKDLLVQNNAPKHIDYLTIDIEGAEDRALLKFPFDEYRFTCITIERPSAELKKVFEANGYILIKEIVGLDCFYIHNSFTEQYCKNMYAFGRKKFLLKPLKD